MENIENNDIITTEAIEEITEDVPTGKSGLKTAAKVGVIGAVSIAAWEFAVKPLGRKIKGLINKRKAAKKPKKTEEEEIDLDYLVGYLNTAYAREFFTAGVAATTNSMLKPKDVLSIPIPMLPMEEQRMLGRLYRLSAEKQQILKKMLANEEALADSIITSAVREVVKHA